MTVGIYLAWTSPVLPILENRLGLQTAQGAWIGSLVPVGGFIGALPAGFLVNNFGRKQTLVSS